MAGLKSLAKETAIYGLSSIVGRFLNYLLVPVYTMALSAQSGGYGVVTNIYAWVALLLVLLTCGMETGFFRFANKGEDDPMRVYSTTLLSVGIGALTFLALGLLFLQPVADWLEYGEHPWYVGMMMIVVAMDAIQSIPFAYLRYKKRPVKFAALKLLFIFLNIALNLIYYVWMKGDDVAYAFLFNLVCTSTIMLCMIPELRGFAYVLDRKLLKRMLAYSLPLRVGHCGHPESGGGQDYLSLCLPRPGGSHRTTRHLWSRQQDCHGDGDADTGFPLRLRTFCIRQEPR